MTNLDKMLKKSDVANLLGCCARSLERRVKLGTFPPPLRFGKESVWFEIVIAQWLENERQAQLNWQPVKAKTKRMVTAVTPVTRVTKPLEADPLVSLKSGLSESERKSLGGIFL